MVKICGWRRDEENYKRLMAVLDITDHWILLFRFLISTQTIHHFVRVKVALISN